MALESRFGSLFLLKFMLLSTFCPRRFVHKVNLSTMKSCFGLLDQFFQVHVRECNLFSVLLSLFHCRSVVVVIEGCLYTKIIPSGCYWMQGNLRVLCGRDEHALEPIGKTWKKLELFVGNPCF